MAALTLTIRAETDAVLDDVRRLVGVHQALAHRHGPAFRALDRDIDRALEAFASAAPDFAQLADADGLHLIMLTPPEIHALLARAVALDVRPAPVG